MDALLAEINAKKTSLAALNGSSSKNAEAGPSSSKYMRRAEIEAAQEEEAKRKREEAREKLRAEKEARLAKKTGGGKEGDQLRHSAFARLAGSPTPGRSATGTPEPDSLNPANPSAAQPKEISTTELIRRLRLRGQPIWYFGETDKDRRQRLRTLELEGDRGSGSGARVDEFRKTLRGVEEGILERDAERAGGRKRKVDQVEGGGAAGEGEKSLKGGVVRGDGEGDVEGGKRKEEKRVEVGLIDLVEVKREPNKAYPLVYWAFKNVFREWEEWMDSRPDDVKRSTQGKLALANQVQSGVNLKPLYKQLRARSMPPDVIYKLAELVHHMQSRQYQRANDAYLRLSIGNAAWPIGVTSVGLHERGAREKITEDVVAHVLNDEVSRKWIQSVKRCVCYLPRRVQRDSSLD